MFCKDVCLGTACGIEKLRSLSDTLNAKVVNQLNGSQELVMLTGFARESNEYEFKKSLQDRISDVASWRWVLEDLSKRLDESIIALKYEHNALRVVVHRVQEEMDSHCREGSRPGAICPLTDIVEEAVIQEFNFLRDQKKNFENLILELDKQIGIVEKTKKKIETDVLNKQKTLNIEEACANKDYTDSVIGDWKKRKKGSPVARWIKRCEALKRSGLKALSNAVITRQQVRGARVRLSIGAQSLAAKVDAALRRRLHANRIKLQDLNWQREEHRDLTTPPLIDGIINSVYWTDWTDGVNSTPLVQDSQPTSEGPFDVLRDAVAVRDYNSLQEELSFAEKTVVEVMDQERIVEARLADRANRPNRELIKDDVNRKLRNEQNQLRRFAKDLRYNIEEIITLQNNISEAIALIDCCAEDLLHVIQLDEDRIRCRQGGTNQSDTSTATTTDNNSRVTAVSNLNHSQPMEMLTVIQEENEDVEDDYPFDF